MAKDRGMSGAKLFIDTSIRLYMVPQRNLTVRNMVMYIEHICFCHPIPLSVFYKKLEKKFGPVYEDELFNAMMELENKYNEESGIEFVIGADSVGFIPKDEARMKWD